MLKGIHPLLGPDLLHALRSMGHGDDIVIADANFPVTFLGPRVVRADGVDAVAMAEAILTHMPLDTFVPKAAWRMEVVGDPGAVPEVCATFQEVVTSGKFQGTIRLAMPAGSRRRRAPKAASGTGTVRFWLASRSAASSA